MTTGELHISHLAEMADDLRRLAEDGRGVRDMLLSLDRGRREVMPAERFMSDGTAAFLSEMGRASVAAELATLTRDRMEMAAEIAAVHADRMIPATFIRPKRWEAML